MANTLQAEFRTLELPAGFDISASRSCEDNATDCCETQVSCLPTGTLGLRVERTRIYFPPGAYLGEEYCELSAACCPGDGLTGTGNCGTIVTGCCPDGMPTTLALVLDTNCTCINGLHSVTWDGVDRWTLTQTICGQSVVMQIRCVSGDLQFSIECGGSRRFTVSLTVNSCCPFSAIGTVAAAGINCCATEADGTVTVSDPGDSGDSTTGPDCLVLLRKQRIYLPGNATLGDPFCVDNPECDCEGDYIYPLEEYPIFDCGDPSACDISIPNELFATFLSISNPDYADLEGHTTSLFRTMDPLNPSDPPLTAIWQNYFCFRLPPPGPTPPVSWHRSISFRELFPCILLGGPFDPIGHGAVETEIGMCYDTDGTILVSHNTRMIPVIHCQDFPIVHPGNAAGACCNSTHPWNEESGCCETTLSCFTTGATTTSTASIPCARPVDSTLGPFSMKDINGIELFTFELRIFE